MSALNMFNLGTLCRCIGPWRFFREKHKDMQVLGVDQLYIDNPDLLHPADSLITAWKWLFLPANMSNLCVKTRNQPNSSVAVSCQVDHPTHPELPMVKRPSLSLATLKLSSRPEFLKRAARLTHCARQKAKQAPEMALVESAWGILRVQTVPSWFPEHLGEKSYDHCGKTEKNSANSPSHVSLPSPARSIKFQWQLMGTMMAKHQLYRLTV